MADRVASLPDRQRAASQETARRAQEAAREKQYMENRALLKTPLPSVPASVPQDSRGYRTMMDETMTNKYSQSPVTGRVTHSTVNDAPGGQIKLFTPIRKGFPGEVGDRVTSSRDPSPAGRPQSPAGYPRNYPSSQTWNTRQAVPESTFPFTTDRSPGRSADRMNQDRQFRPSQSRSGGMVTSRQSRSRFKDQARSVRILNSDNVNYWKGKICTHCNKRDHGAHVCPIIKCKTCGLNGVHRNPVACDNARNAKALQTLAFLAPPSRDQSRDPSQTRSEKMEINVVGREEFQETHKHLLNKMEEAFSAVLTKNEEGQQE